MTFARELPFDVREVLVCLHNGLLSPPEEHHQLNNTINFSLRDLYFGLDVQYLRPVSHQSRDEWLQETLDRDLDRLRVLLRVSDVDRRSCLK